MKTLTRIEAVNQILKIKSGERITSESELETIPQAVEASLALDMSVTYILTEYKWFFNKSENVSITSDVNGLATLPTNLSFITFHSTDAAVGANYLRPVAGRVYDVYNHTNNIGASKTVRYTAWVVWDYEDLPIAFQLLAIAHARKEVANDARVSPQRLAIEKDRYGESLQTATKFDDTLSGGRLFNPLPNRRRPPRNNSWLSVGLALISAWFVGGDV